MEYAAGEGGRGEGGREKGSEEVSEKEGRKLVEEEGREAGWREGRKRTGGRGAYREHVQHLPAGRVFTVVLTILNELCRHFLRTVASLLYPDNTTTELTARRTFLCSTVCIMVVITLQGTVVFCPLERIRQ